MLSLGGVKTWVMPDMRVSERKKMLIFGLD